MHTNVSIASAPQTFSRVLPFLGAVMVVVVWYVGIGLLSDVTLPTAVLVATIGGATAPVEMGQAIAVGVLTIGVVGMALSLTGLMRRQHRLVLRLRRCEADLAEARLRSRRCVEDLERVADLAAHDLREPLRRIVSYAQLLVEGDRPDLDDETRFRLFQVIDGARRMNDLIGGLSAFISVDSRPATMARVQPAMAVAMARRRLAGMISRVDAALIVDPLPDVVADAQSLAEIFTHLIDNALRFRSSSRRPVVHVSGDRRGGMITLRVRDNGLGIDPVRVGRMFEMFHHPMAVEGERTGMGLAMVRRLVERMGGEICVDSLPGQGSTFGFTLPAVAIDRGVGNDMIP